MPTIAGWSLLAIAAVIAIAAGIVLLAAYALRRGVVHRELHGTVESEGEPQAVAAASTEVSATASPEAARTLGVAGAVLLAVGLGLGVVGVATGWGVSESSATGLPGQPPADCAQTWEGCPQETPVP